MTIKYIITAIAGCLFSLVLQSQMFAKPPDAAFDLFYTGLRDLAGKIESGGIPNEEELKLTKKALASGDDLITAMALACLRELGIAAANTQVESLGLDKQKIGPLSSAITVLIHEEAAMDFLPVKDRIKKLASLTYSKQPYLSIEAAKRLAHYDITTARAALQRIANGLEDESLAAELLLQKIAQKQEGQFTPKLAGYENIYYDFEQFTGHLGEAKWLNKIKAIGDEKRTEPKGELPSQSDHSALNQPASTVSARASHKTAYSWPMFSIGAIIVVVSGLIWRACRKRG